MVLGGGLLGNHAVLCQVNDNMGNVQTRRKFCEFIRVKMDYSCVEERRSRMLQRTVCSFFYAFGVMRGWEKAGRGLDYCIMCFPEDGYALEAYFFFFFGISKVC